MEENHSVDLLNTLIIRIHQVLNNMKSIKLAVSLGSTESLAQHPYTMTHADVDCEIKNELGLTEKMVRLSVGVENVEDIWTDIKGALDAI